MQAVIAQEKAYVDQLQFWLTQILHPLAEAALICRALPMEYSIATALRLQKPFKIAGRIKEPSSF